MYTMLKNTEQCNRDSAKCRAERMVYRKDRNMKYRQGQDLNWGGPDVRLGHSSFGVRQHVKWIWLGGKNWKLAPGEEKDPETECPKGEPDDDAYVGWVYDTALGNINNTKAWSKREEEKKVKTSLHGQKKPGSQNSRPHGTHKYPRTEFIGDGGAGTHVHKYKSGGGARENQQYRIQV